MTRALVAATAAAVAGARAGLSGRRGSQPLAGEYPRRADGTYRTYEEPTANRSRHYRVVMPATKRRARWVNVWSVQWPFLTSLPPVNEISMYEVSWVDMMTNRFESTINASMGEGDGPAVQSIEYHLDRTCTRFRGFFGLSADSDADGKAIITARANGGNWFSGVFTIVGYRLTNILWTTPLLKIRFESRSDNPTARGLGPVESPAVRCTR